MSNIFRKIFNKLNRSYAENTTPKRRKLSVPIKVSIEPDRVTGRLSAKREMISLTGVTRDMSKSGVAFTVSSIRLREYYLVGENRVLHTELDLPNGKIKLKLVGVRYEQVDIHNSTTSFLIGAKIISIEPQEKEIYDEYVRLGNKLKGGKREFSLGVDG